MSFIWNALQQYMISEQYNDTMSLEDRVQYLERDLKRTRKMLFILVDILENQLGEDLDNDGHIGTPPSAPRRRKGRSKK